MEKDIILNRREEFVKVSIHYGEADISVSSSNVNNYENRIILMGENFDLIPHHSTVDLIGYFEDGLKFMSAKVSLSTDSQVNLDILKTDDKQNRRRYVRVKVYEKTKLIRAFSLGKSSKIYSINEVVETRDVNLEGVGFYSNSFLFRKQRIDLDFSFLKPGLEVEAEIIRIEKGIYNSGFKYKYGCRFLHKNSEEERLICEFVFKVQAQNRKKLYKDEDDF